MKVDRHIFSFDIKNESGNLPIGSNVHGFCLQYYILWKAILMPCSFLKPISVPIPTRNKRLQWIQVEALINVPSWPAGVP